MISDVKHPSKDVAALGGSEDHLTYLISLHCWYWLYRSCILNVEMQTRDKKTRLKKDCLLTMLEEKRCGVLISWSKSWTHTTLVSIRATILIWWAKLWAWKTRKRSSTFLTMSTYSPLKQKRSVKKSIKIGTGSWVAHRTHQPRQMMKPCSVQ